MVDPPQYGDDENAGLNEQQQQELPPDDIDPIYREALRSIGRAISLAQGDDAKLVVFRNSVFEVVTRWHGLERQKYFDALQDIALAKGLIETFGADAIQNIYLDAVAEQQAKQEQPKTNGKTHASSKIQIIDDAEFLSGFVPPDYLIDGILHRRFVYALTGQTGHAKSAVALLCAQLVSSADRNAVLGTHRVEKGRVCYFVGENPDDIRMRRIGANAYRQLENPDDDPKQDRVHYILGAINIAEAMKDLQQNIHKLGGFDLIIVDTSAAYFLGADEVSNTDMGKHARMLRALTTLPGSPCVLVLCHPIKHAETPAQLLPRGGGAFLAEMDGNLTLWKHDEILVELHHGKIRGPGFEPIMFKLERIETSDLLDAKGRRLPTVRAVAITQSDEDSQTKKTRDDEDHVLAVLLKNADASIAEIAIANGWTFGSGEPAKSRVQRAVGRLERSKPMLLQKDRDRWALTEKGKDHARKASLRFLNEMEDTAQGAMFKN
jgi:hypothetical protein